MLKIISLGLNYTDPLADIEELIKKEFYAARDWMYQKLYVEYFEEKALPLQPQGTIAAKEPLATYRVKDDNDDFHWINIYAKAGGGMVVTDLF